MQVKEGLHLLFYRLCIAFYNSKRSLRFTCYRQVNRTQFGIFWSCYSHCQLTLSFLNHIVTVRKACGQAGQIEFYLTHEVEFPQGSNCKRSRSFLVDGQVGRADTQIEIGERFTNKQPVAICQTTFAQHVSHTDKYLSIFKEFIGHLGIGMKSLHPFTLVGIIVDLCQYLVVFIVERKVGIDLRTQSVSHDLDDHILSLLSFHGIPILLSRNTDHAVYGIIAGK